ncbi:hypothetical protein F0562_002624 [Nyssa sinensis]|uniref:Pentacotripeptide-repeat region of PRORP domain-containing protein n=1 Tax=Nyssa sinensis TaxID=561372 RepID=A0A5J5CA49_9ASTE|nr:hypothetical protein F0562_002624 [Nyssa sinensis]
MLRTFLSRSPHSLFKDTRYHHLVSTTSTATDLFVSFLNQCSNAKHLYQIHGFMVPRGLDQDNLFLSRFIDACSALGFLDHGYSAFTQKTHPNIYLYNTMIKVLSRQPHSANVAIILYNKVRATGLRSDTYTFPFALKAVVCLSVIEVGREIHGQAIRTGLDGDVHVGTALVQMYSLCGCISDARKLFDRMCFRDVAFWNAMVAGYAKVGDVDSARDLFERMPEKNVISWTAVITGYTQMNQSTEAIVIFRRMQLEKVEPDEVAMLAALSACAQLGALELGEWIHDYIHIHGLHKTIPLCNALIDMYAKSGNIIKAVDVFENLKHKNVITWTTMIAGLALHGLGREALEMFTRMENGRIKPNDITLIAILSACSHAGLVEIGSLVFQQHVFKIWDQTKD